MPRSAEVTARIEKDGRTIRLTFKEHDVGPITFKQDTGSSGPGAFDKLRTVLNKVSPKD